MTPATLMECQHFAAPHLYVLAALQVRQKLYNTAIGKWRNYEEQLQPIVSDLHEYVERYEAGLGKSRHMMSSSRGLQRETDKT